MPPFRVIHISDTHLSRHRAWFVPNFQAMAGIISDVYPDLVVNTGDISFDGANREDDLAFSRMCHARLDVPFCAVPGNHDVGDNPWSPGIAPAITEPRLGRYREQFGPDHWMLDAGHWVLIGLNVQLFGSGLPAETEQWTFLTAAAAKARGRPVALFVHKPLFHERADEAEVSHRYVPPDHRGRVLDLLGPGLQLVASGHVHQHRRLRVDGIAHCWAPSTAFVLPDHRQPRLGTKHIGYIDYAFHEDRVDVRVVEPSQLTNHDLDEFPEAYQH